VGPDNPWQIAADLTPNMRRAILAFGGEGWGTNPPGSGWWREWCDIVEQCGPRASHRHCIDTLIRRGLAERATGPSGMMTFRRLTPLGCRVRRIVEEDNSRK
jgi:hypothetical protein